MDCAAHHALHDPCALFCFLFFDLFLDLAKATKSKVRSPGEKKRRKQRRPAPDLAPSSPIFCLPPKKGVGVPLPPHRGETSGEGYSSRPTLPRWGPNDRKQCRARLSPEQRSLHKAAWAGRDSGPGITGGGPGVGRHRCARCVNSIGVNSLASE